MVKTVLLVLCGVMALAGLVGLVLPIGAESTTVTVAAVGLLIAGVIGAMAVYLQGRV